MMKLGEAVAKLLGRHSEQWTSREIAEECDISASRISEYRNYEKYKKAVSASHLAKFIGYGFFTMDELVKEVAGDLSEKEKKHLRDIEFYGDTNFKKSVIRKNEVGGLTPAEALQLVTELEEKGIDVGTILRQMRGK